MLHVYTEIFLHPEQHTAIAGLNNLQPKLRCWHLAGIRSDSVNIAVNSELPRCIVII